MFPPLRKIVIPPGYITAAVSTCFGFDGWTLTKALFGTIWVYIELMALIYIGMAVYVVARTRMDPEMYVPAGESTEMLTVIFITTAIQFSIPLLLDAGVELISR